MVGLYLPSLQAPSSHLPLPGMGGKYLYIQVENAMAVQVVQPLHQLLDVDLDLWWQRPGAQVKTASLKLPIRFPPCPIATYVSTPSRPGMVHGQAMYKPSHYVPQYQGFLWTRRWGEYGYVEWPEQSCNHDVSGADEGWPTGQVWAEREKW